MMKREHSNNGVACYSWGGACVLIVVLLIGIFYVLTLREGHTWGDDFAQYIYHARNLAEGRPYNETGYFRNALILLGPEAYPPLTSIVLAPIWYFFQLDLVAMKVTLIAIFCIALMAIDAAMRDRLSNKYRVVLLLLFALNPYLWDMKDRIQSEYLYILVSFVSLIVMHRYYSGGEESRSITGAFAIGISIYLAWATRQIGLVLLPTLLVYELWSSHKLTRNFFLATGLFVMLALLQTQVLEFDRAVDPYDTVAQDILKDMNLHGVGHLGLLRFDIHKIASQGINYLQAIKDFWSSTHVLALFLFVVCGLLAASGFVRQAITRLTVFEVYTAGYCALLLEFRGFQGIRYLVPVIPLYLMYVMHGIKWLEQFAGRWLYAMLLASILCCATVVYLDSYRKENFHVIEHGISSPETEELLSFIRDNTLHDDVIVFRKPRALSLLAERRSVAYPIFSGRPQVVNDYVSAIHADYIIAGNFVEDSEFLIPALALQPHAYQQVYQNGEFKVFRYAGPDQ